MFYPLGTALLTSPGFQEVHFPFALNFSLEIYLVSWRTDAVDMMFTIFMNIPRYL